ncbi:cation transporter [Methylopila jiangsuensis]|uniref:Cation transporter n=1 Tax=Methylopila jiangsuensis TaxID=586230 RepID=A0A9W6N4J0_9HYPH|nr:CDF family Co(II)/Ni(II) efflux transporter DmeF [Methylopila jiangsuensis]MDR6286431.1 cation diffusion facilitator family transporter [Methylopila jiangsuensis]GLK77232.1 cation transporter [Methylopila jiangsuensis]
MHLTEEGRRAFAHDHRFLGAEHARNERRTLIVVAITAAMMVVEILAGWAYGSMALLADGWHMATHAGAIGLAAFAYRFAARHDADPRFSFGAGKVGDLAGFSSAIVLGVIALAIGVESVVRLTAPQPVAYAEATAIAVIGLAVNVVCALLLGHDHSHGGGRHHGHHHGHGHDRHDHADDHDHDGHAHDDHNLRGAYVHVLADALTSALAIGGLLAGWRFGWTWVDPAIGVVGAGVIGWWSISLARDTGRVLVDATPDARLAAHIRATLETGDVRVTDLHLWRIGPGHMAAIVSLVTHRPEQPAAYKARLGALEGLSHVTVEVNLCEGETRRYATA